MTQAPFDARFKILAEEYPELLLKLLGIVDLDTPREVVHLLRELQLDPLEVDHVYRIGSGKSGKLVHFEAITRWEPARTSRLALYRLLLKHKFNLPVSSYVVFMAQKYVPKRLPKRVIYKEPDGFRVEAPYRVIRLWEINPELAFQPGGEPLLPWVPLLRGGRAEFQRAVEEIARLTAHPAEAPYGVPVMVSNIATLATLRYDKEVINQLLDHLRSKTMLSTEVLKVSWLYKDGVKEGRKRGRKDGRKEGRQEGRQEGLQEGKLAGKRESLRLALDSRFPSIGTLPQLDHIDRLEVIDQLLAAVLKARSLKEVRAAILLASSEN